MRIAASLFLLLALLPRVAGAQGLQVERLEVGFAGRFRPGVWTPIRIDVACGAGGYAGDLDVLVDGHPALRFEVNIAAGGGTTLQGLVILPQTGSVVTVAGTAAAPLRAVSERTPLVAVQNSLSSAAEARATCDPAPEFARVDPLRLPGREGAWDAVDALILDSRMRTEIERNAGARQAFAEWRARGGIWVDADAPAGPPASVTADARRSNAGDQGARGLFPADPWSGHRRERLLAFLAWFALGASATIFLAALRADSSSRTLRLAVVAGLLLTLAWTRALSPGAITPARALARCVVSDGGILEEVWVCAGGESRAAWGHARTPERPFRPETPSAPAVHRIGVRETWPAAAEELILHRVRALRETRPRPALADAIVAGPAGFYWVGRVEPDDKPIPLDKEPTTLARLVEHYVTSDPRAADRVIARLERVFAGIDPSAPWLVGRAEGIDALLPPDADPVEGPGVYWVVPFRK